VTGIELHPRGGEDRPGRALALQDDALRLACFGGLDRLIADVPFGEQRPQEVGRGSIAVQARRLVDDDDPVLERLLGVDERPLAHPGDGVERRRREEAQHGLDQEALAGGAGGLDDCRQRPIQHAGAQDEIEELRGTFLTHQSRLV
jgi:hypothetical protein